jgi:hypothetical protein
MKIQSNSVSTSGATLGSFLAYVFLAFFFLALGAALLKHGEHRSESKSNPVPEEAESFLKKYDGSSNPEPKDEKKARKPIPPEAVKALLHYTK